MNLTQRIMKNSNKEEQINKAIEWIDKKLSEPDVEGFYIAPATYNGLHQTLKMQRASLKNCDGMARDTAYYQVKKIKTFLENECIKRVMEL